MQPLEGALEILRRWDERACSRATCFIRHRALLRAMRAASWLGDGIFWYLLMLVLLLAQRGDAALPVLHMVLVGLAGTCVYRLLKSGTHRPRPFETHRHITAGAVPLDRYSFPSGHTLHAVAFTAVALAYYPALAPLVLPMAIAIAASRVVLGLHYPSDVLAGAVLGGVIAWLSLQLA
jgi:undecaprenyl-diphosphatase